MFNGYGFGYGYYSTDQLYLFGLIILAVVGMIASSRVQSAFRKYSSLPASCGLTAAETARRLLLNGGSNAQLQRVSGALTDHYDPRNNTVGLSEAVYDQSSVSALAVAAHEIGHVMQYQEGYGPIKLRNAVLPVARLSSTVAPWLVLLGVFMGSYPLATFGTVLFAAILLFQVATLPVEFNASRRAIAMLTEGGYLSSREEEQAAKKVLKAAAMTYVVAALSTFLTFLRLLSLSNRARRR